MNILYTLDLIGTTAFAASGAWAGVRRDMDLLGVLALGLVTATGGGILLILIHKLGVSHGLAAIVAALTTIIIRLLAISSSTTKWTRR